MHVGVMAANKQSQIHAAQTTMTEARIYGMKGVSFAISILSLICLQIEGARLTQLLTHMVTEHNDLQSLKAEKSHIGGYTTVRALICAHCSETESKGSQSVGELRSQSLFGRRQH
jgi:hypothetical protein